MIIAEARVLRCDERYLWVDVQRPGGCSSCSSQSGCSTAVLASFFSHADAPLRLERGDTPARLPGETVRIGIRESTLLRGSLLLYLLPLVGLIGGAVLAQVLAGPVFPDGNETPAVLGGLLGLTGAFWLIRRQAAKRSEDGPDIQLLR